jgi:hypothetical protein
MKYEVTQKYGWVLMTTTLVENFSIIIQYGTRYAKNVTSKPKQVGRVLISMP